MICEQCVAQAQRSRVYPGPVSTTLLTTTRYYDEDGQYHNHDSNQLTQSFSCSNGHAWTVQSYAPCPAPACTWNTEHGL